MKIIITAFIILFTYTSWAQEAPVKNTPRTRRMAARQQIHDLENGVLLVRLPTREKTIAALRAKGNNALADKIDAQQMETNIRFISAFKKFFNFCPVYFFKSNYSEAVRQKMWNEVVFVNEYLQPDTSVKIAETKIFTAELTGTEPARSGRGSSMHVGAIVIKDDQFQTLQKPFPYYMRTFEGVPWERPTDKVVLRLNNKLHKFYSENK